MFILPRFVSTTPTTLLSRSGEGVREVVLGRTFRCTSNSSSYRNDHECPAVRGLFPSTEMNSDECSNVWSTERRHLLLIFAGQRPSSPTDLTPHSPTLRPPSTTTEPFVLPTDYPGGSNSARTIYTGGKMTDKGFTLECRGSWVSKLGLLCKQPLLYLGKNFHLPFIWTEPPDGVPR